MFGRKAREIERLRAERDDCRKRMVDWLDYAGELRQQLDVYKLAEAGEENGMKKAPLIETSWGYGPISGIEDFEGEDGEIEEAEVTLFNGWTLYCLRHGFIYMIEADGDDPPEALAESPDMWCPSCEEEWAVYINRVRRELPPDDLAADQQRWLEELRHEEQREGDEERRTLGR